MSKVIHGESKTFEDEVVNSNVPVFVDFWAEWCAPCRAITPILEQLASDFEGRVKVVKINVDENPDLAQNYGVQAIPTLLIFKNGQTVDQIVGAVQKSHYADKLKQVIGN
ncbi:MAG: thioredoxin [Nitrososphaerales archaeon]